MEKTQHFQVGKQPFMGIRQLTVTGLLAGITVFLGMTGYGFIPLIFMSATILHIPTIIGGMTSGPRVGAVVGFMFGMFSFIQTLRAPSLLMQFAVQYNIVYDALICIVPRVCIGFLAWWLYRRLPLKRWMKALSAAVAVTLCHTVLFLGTFLALVGAPYAEAHGIPLKNVLNILIGITVVNGIPEAVISGVIITPIVLALEKSGWKA